MFESAMISKTRLRILAVFIPLFIVILQPVLAQANPLRFGRIAGASLHSKPLLFTVPVLRQRILTPSFPSFTTQVLAARHSTLIQFKQLYRVIPVKDEHQQKDQEASLYYLSKQELDKLEVTIIDGKFYDYAHQLISHGDSLPRMTKRFVMNEKGQIYVEQLPWEWPLCNRIKHSSFLGGQPVAAAGFMYIVNGELREINNFSGHYQPSREDFDQVIDQLDKQGIGMGTYKVEVVEPHWVGL